MPQARITVNGVPGSNIDLPIGVLVLLNNQNVGGEVTFKWTVVDQPAGPIDALSSISIQNPTITIRKEGTYKLLLIVNEGLPSEVRDEVVIAVLQLKTRTRVPAVSETIQASSVYGWAGSAPSLPGANPTLQRLDAAIADPDFVVAQISGAPAATSVVRMSSAATIKAGLPGAEVVPVLAPALATSVLVLTEPLGVLVSAVDGGALSAGKLANVRKSGLITNVALVGAVVNDLVYVSDTGALSLTAGTNSRRVGYVLTTTGAVADVWFDGRIPFSASSGVSWPLLAPDGSAAAPSYAFATVPGTGLYYNSGSLSVSVTGAERWRFGTDSITAITSASRITNITTNGSLHIGGRITTAAGSSITLGQHSAVPFAGASVAQVGVELLPTVNQTGTSSFSALKLSVTETAVGSGTQRLIEANIGGTTHFSVSAGANPGRVSAHVGTAALPGFVFNGSAGTGFWSNVGVDLRFSIGGAQTHVFSATTLSLAPGTGNSYTQQFVTTNNRHIITGRVDQTSSTLPSVQIDQALPFIGASVSQRQLKIESTINQTLTSAFTSLEINQIQTALGSGAQRFISSTVSGTEIFAVTSDTTMPGQVLAAQGSAARPTYSFAASPTTGLYWNGGFQVLLSFAGSSRLSLGGASTSWGISATTTNTSVTVGGNVSTSTIPQIIVGGPTMTGASAAQVGLSYTQTLNQSGTSGFLQLVLAQTQTAIGSGTHRFIDASIGGTTHFAISSGPTPGRIHANVGAVATPSYSFLGAEGAGMWWTGSAIEWSISGATRLRFTTAEIQFTSGGSSALSNVTTNTLLGIEGRISTSNSVTSLQIRNGVNFTGSSGIQRGVSIDYTLNQTSTAGFIAQQIRLTHTAIGSGLQKFQSFEIGGTEHFYVTSGADPGRVAAHVGAVGTPSFTFVGDENTGIYSSAADVVSVAVGGLVAAQFSQYVATFPNGFNSATPGITFNGDTDTGLYLRAVGELGFSAANNGRMYLGSAGLMPEVDNTYALGKASERWSDVFAVQTTIGDLVMRDPHTRGKTVDQIAHWKLIEGVDGITAYNVRTGKKYQIVMDSAPMTEHDMKLVQAERERWAQ